jgi:hypothetical protein
MGTSLASNRSHKHTHKCTHTYTHTLSHTCTQQDAQSDDCSIDPVTNKPVLPENSVPCDIKVKVKQVSLTLSRASCHSLLVRNNSYASGDDTLGIEGGDRALVARQLIYYVIWQVHSTSRLR